MDVNVGDTIKIGRTDSSDGLLYNEEVIIKEIQDYGTFVQFVLVNPNGTYNSCVNRTELRELLKSANNKLFNKNIESYKL